jgi:hypothetical protein
MKMYAGNVSVECLDHFVLGFIELSSHSLIH